jgi:hypothetical protein
VWAPGRGLDIERRKKANITADNGTSNMRRPICSLGSIIYPTILFVMVKKLALNLEEKLQIQSLNIVILGYDAT